MSSEVLPVRTFTESNSIEVKNALTTSSLTGAPISTGPNAIFSVVPINLDDYGPYGKPNAIVRPLRRNEPNEMIVPEANVANVPASDQSSPKVNVPAKCRKREIDTFSKELDNKLRHLQKDKKTSSKNVNLRILLVHLVCVKFILSVCVFSHDGVWIKLLNISSMPAGFLWSSIFHSLYWLDAAHIKFPNVFVDLLLTIIDIILLQSDITVEMTKKFRLRNKSIKSIKSEHSYFVSWEFS